MASPVRTNRFYRFGSFRLDADARVLLRNGGVVPLPPKVIDTLLVLVKSAGQPVEKEALIHAVGRTPLSRKTTSPTTSRFSENARQWRGWREYIETIPKRGYRFVGR